MIASLLVAATGLPAWGQGSAQDRFLGGSYDGWDCETSAPAGLGGPLVVLSSGQHQTFAWSAANPALADITITAEFPAGTLTNGGVMRISLPSGWRCRFDEAASVTLEGSAVDASKVGPFTYTDSGRTLELAVTGDFQNGDTLTVKGLRLLDLRLLPEGSGQMELDFTGNGARDVYDLFSLFVTVHWRGGSHDGWDISVMETFTSLRGQQGSVFFLR